MIDERSDLTKLMKRALQDAKANIDDVPARRAAIDEAAKVASILSGVRDRIMKIIGWPTPPKWGDRGNPMRDPVTPNGRSVVTLDSDSPPSPADPSEFPDV